MCVNCTIRRDHVTAHCAFCGKGISPKNYAEHLAKKHPGGRIYQPFNNRPTKTLAQLLADPEFPLLECGIDTEKEEAQ